MLLGQLTTRRASSPMARAMIRIIVAAGVRLFREGLADALESQDNLAVVATVADSASLDETVARHPADVLVVDSALTGARASMMRLRLRHPDLKVVALGQFVDASEVISYAEAGVAGFLTRDQALTDLLRTIAGVVEGDLHCAPHVSAALLHRVATIGTERAPARRVDARLTARELEIAALLGDGLSNKEIARRLHIEVPTVKNHVHHILAKLQFSSRMDAALWARGAAPRAF